MAYFWCKNADRWEDSWTYGDYRQYICNRPSGGKGQTQCARIVLTIPFGPSLMKAVGPMNDGSRRVFPWEAS